MELENNDKYLNQDGLLDVGYHKIHWEDWGNKNATAIMYFHGGPGTEYSQDYRELFEPEKHRVIFHNQRGAGKSIPYADTTENTTQDRSEERRVGKECGGMCRSRWSPYH